MFGLDDESLSYTGQLGLGPDECNSFKVIILDGDVMITNQYFLYFHHHAIFLLYRNNFNVKTHEKVLLTSDIDDKKNQSKRHHDN
jgi:hypothetical protein